MTTGAAPLLRTTRSSRWLAGVWTVVVVFAIVTAVWSWHVGVPLRDPEGKMFRGRLAKSLTFFAVLVVAQAVVRSLRSGRSVRGARTGPESAWSWRSPDCSRTTWSTSATAT